MSLIPLSKPPPDVCKLQSSIRPRRAPRQSATGHAHRVRIGKLFQGLRLFWSDAVVVDPACGLVNNFFEHTLSNEIWHENADNDLRNARVGIPHATLPRGRGFAITRISRSIGEGLTMFRRVFSHVALFGFSAATVMFGACGGSGVELADMVKISVDQEEKVAEVQVMLNDNVEVDAEGEIPIEKFGSIAFVQAGYDTPAMIVLKANYGNYTGGLAGHLGQASTLPNGGRFPSSVVPPLYFVEVPSQGTYQPIFYFAAEPYVQVGAALLLQAIGDRIPPGFVISQVFRDKQKRPVASVSLFGPKLNEYGTVDIAGGLYFHANFGVKDALPDGDPIVIGGDGEGSGKVALRRTSAFKANRIPIPVRTEDLYNYNWELDDPLGVKPRGLGEALNLKYELQRALKGVR